MESKSTKKEVAALSAPSLPWRTRIALAAASALTDAARRSDGTVNRVLIRLLEPRTSASPKTPIRGVISRDVTVDAARNLWFRLFIPTSTSAGDDGSSSLLPVIVFFHGGGFVYLSADSIAYDAVCRRFARKIRAVVISVNYRLAPEHKYPAQYDDGFDVLKFLDEDGGRILPENADVSACFLAGDSAGGNLAHHVAMRACESRFRKLKVIGVIAIQPFFGGEERTEAETRLAKVEVIVSTARTDWMWKAFLPSQQGLNRDHEVINVTGPRAVDLSRLDFPPVLVVVAGFDSLQDWQRRYYEWLKRSGKEAYLLEFPTMVHAFYVFPELPESGELISEVKDFMSKRISVLSKI